MTTASTEWPPSSSKRVLVVRPRSASETAIGRSEVARKAVSSAPRNAFGTSTIASKGVAPRPGQVSRGAGAVPHLGQHLRLAFESVPAVLVDLRHRLRHRIPMPGKKDLRFKGGQAIERVQVGGDVALGVGDHRAALAEDQVAG